MPEVVILRHAQSAWNRLGLWQGQADPPLSGDGVAQAAVAAPVLASFGPFDLVASSDLIRARVTAELLTGDQGQRLVDPGLREYDVGGWSGHTRDEIESLWPGQLARYRDHTLLAPPGGESREAFEQRISSACQRVGEAAAAHSADRVLIVSHGGVIGALARLAGCPEYHVGALAGYRGTIEAGGIFPDTPIDLLAGQPGVDSHWGALPSHP